MKTLSRQSMLPVLIPPLLVWAFLAGAAPCLAQAKNQVIFRQDLGTFGFKYQYGRNDQVSSIFTDLAFLSEDLLLVSVKVRTADDVKVTILPSGVRMYDNPAGGNVPPTSLSTLLLFSVEQKKLVRSARLPVRKADETVQAGPPDHFFMLGSYGLQLCSAEFACSAPRPAYGPMSVSPRGTRVIVGGYNGSDRQLLTADKLALLETFGRKGPDVIPGDGGVLLHRYPITAVRMDDGKEVELGFQSRTVFPEARFLDQDTVIGLKMPNISDGLATVAKVDGSILFQVPVKEAWRGNTRFIPSASGSRFCIAELRHAGLNAFVNFFDITSDQPYGRREIRVFEVASGKQVFELHWDPRSHQGENALPALSPRGHRLALLRKGELLVYEIP
jgi:hypothetical protein